MKAEDNCRQTFKKYKLNWKIKKGRGNVKKSWTLYHDKVSLCEIRMFQKGEYCLPCELFPRDKNFMPQKTKTLIAAKYICELWIIEFSKSILNK